MPSKAERFHALHQTGCFVIANAWDAGSAKLLAQSGFAALATTSAGLAFMLGRPDGEALVTRDALVPLDTLREAGVRRVSVGGAIARSAYERAITMGAALMAGEIPTAMAGIMPNTALNDRMRRNG